MTETSIAYTNLRGSGDAGRELGRKIASAMSATPDAVVLFISPIYEQAELLESFKQACGCRLMIGCSSAGEFTSAIQGEGLAGAIALRSTEMHFSIGVGHHLSRSRSEAAREIISTFQGNATLTYRYHTAFVLTDALVGLADDLIEQLTLGTAGAYQFVGGGAGDNAQFVKTPVFYNTEVLTDTAVALEILSHKPLGIGVRHGWIPTNEGMRVTEAQGMRLVSLNAMPAVEAVQMYAEESGQVFNPADALPFFLMNVLGIDTGMGFKLRMPLEVQADGSIFCAGDIPTGAKVHFMRANSDSFIEAAVGAVDAALAQLQGCTPATAIFFASGQRMRGRGSHPACL